MPAQPRSTVSEPPAAAGEEFGWGSAEELADYAGIGQALLSTSGHAGQARYSRFDLSGHGGTGMISYLEAAGLRVLIMDCRFDDDREFHVRDGDWIRFNFSLDLKVAMNFGDGSSVEESRPSWRLIRTPPDDLVVELVPGGSDLRWVTMCCTPEYLDALTGTSALAWGLSGSGGLDRSVLYRPFDLSAPMASVTNAVLRHTIRPELAAAYVETRCRELALLAVDQLLAESNRINAPIRLSERDLAALHRAKAIIEENITAPHDLQQLSRRVAINRNKLHYGFKSLFGISVHEYVHNLRLEQARRLIEETTAPLSQIAAQVGFHHQCNLSTAFKAYFGITPSSLRKPPAQQRSA